MGWVLLLVLWSLKTTVVDDTDWERLGSFSDVLGSIGEFLHVDWSLLLNLWQAGPRDDHGGDTRHHSSA